MIDPADIVALPVAPAGPMSPGSPADSASLVDMRVWVADQVYRQHDFVRTVPFGMGHTWVDAANVTWDTRWREDPDRPDVIWRAVVLQYPYREEDDVDLMAVYGREALLVDDWVHLESGFYVEFAPASEKWTSCGETGFAPDPDRGREVCYSREVVEDIESQHDAHLAQAQNDLPSSP